MIIQVVTDSTPMTYLGASKLIQGQSVYYNELTMADFCRDSLQCKNIEYAFHSDDGAYHKNDKSSFLFKRLLATDTGQIFILKDCKQITQITNDNYGDFYNFGDLEDSNLLGVVIDWRKVFIAFGNGNYQIQIEYSKAGANDSFRSNTYWVQPYSVESADGTIRIESVNNGEIINGFNFTNLNWPQWYRIEGKLADMQPKYTSDYTESAQREQNIVQKELYNEYTLKSNDIHTDYLMNIQEFSLMGDSLIINDYNIFNAETYRKLQVELVDYKRSEPDNTMKASFEATFRDKKTKVKRI